MKSEKSRKIPLKIGIVGGGQLAQMLALEANAYGLEVHVLSEKSTDPAALVTGHFFQGSPDSQGDQSEFCKNLDLLTFESEFFDMEHFKKLAELSPTYIFPEPQAMAILQDRFSQKNLLKKNKIPTADFLRVQNKQDLLQAFQHFKGQFVLKKCQGGYDGQGTYYSRRQADLESMQGLLPGNFIAESFISFKREMALVIVRSRNGAMITLPLVETKQSHSRCDWVIGPIRHPLIAPLIGKLQRLLKNINYVGAIAFELFDCGRQIMVNEVAPRVHNSAHYSQDALQVSQFLLHLKAGLGESLAPAKLNSPAFAMVNLLGGGASESKMPLNLTGKLHWYGKKENRAGRKLGHINYLGQTTKEVLARGLSERKKLVL
jgi:5-(carboxyamino)imidazole ribonucleotide synthase